MVFLNVQNTKNWNIFNIYQFWFWKISHKHLRNLINFHRLDSFVEIDLTLIDNYSCKIYTL